MEKWQNIEERRRYLGGDFLNYKKQHEGSEKEIIHYAPDESTIITEGYDCIANMRFKDYLFQVYMDIQSKLGFPKWSKNIEGGRSLPPIQYVSPEEIHTLVTLEAILGYSIIDDQEKPGGLRLLKWVRGYAVLKVLAQTASLDNKNPNGEDFMMIISKIKLMEILQSCKLENEESQRFISLVSLHRSSRDMHDCPLININDDQYFIFAPSLIAGNIPTEIISNISSRNITLPQKGSSFENYMREFLRDHGLDVNNFKIKIGNEEYEYDIVFPWGGLYIHF